MGDVFPRDSTHDLAVPYFFPPLLFSDIYRVSGTLFNDVTFNSDNLYVLDGRVLVGPDCRMKGWGP